MSKLCCSRDLLAMTIAYLQKAGLEQKECVVLWLAARVTSNGIERVSEVFQPIQRAKADQFIIPAEGMTALMKHLRDNKLKLVAQIHSHPRKAFHSRADNVWAIVRHSGGLSIVVPYFAQRANADNFLYQAAFFQLSSTDCWLPVDPSASILEVSR